MSFTYDSPSETTSPDAPAANAIAIGGATKSQDGDGVTWGDVIVKTECKTMTHVKDHTPVRWAALEVLVRPSNRLSTSPSLNST